jgi:hypothetical protein
MKNERIYDPCTDTWAYHDGSGHLTEEQIEQRKSMKFLISIEENPIIKAALILKYLTFNHSQNDSKNRP